MRSFLPLVITGFLVIAPLNAMAADTAKNVDKEDATFQNLSLEEKKAKFDAMPDAAKKAFLERRLKKWQGMSREEKLATIEKKRAERLKKIEERYKNMTDADKIKFVDEKYAKLHERFDTKWKSMTDDEKIQFVEDKIVKRAEGKLNELNKKN